MSGSRHHVPGGRRGRRAWDRAGVAYFTLGGRVVTPAKPGGAQRRDRPDSGGRTAAITVSGRVRSDPADTFLRPRGRAASVTRLELKANAGATGESRAPRGCAAAQGRRRRAAASCRRTSAALGVSCTISKAMEQLAAEQGSAPWAPRWSGARPGTWGEGDRVGQPLLTSALRRGRLSETKDSGIYESNRSLQRDRPLMRVRAARFRISAEFGFAGRRRHRGTLATPGQTRGRTPRARQDGHAGRRHELPVGERDRPGDIPLVFSVS